MLELSHSGLPSEANRSVRRIPECESSVAETSGEDEKFPLPGHHSRSRSRSGSGDAPEPANVIVRASNRGRRAPRSRNWCFTDFGLRREQLSDAFHSVRGGLPQVRYICYGDEKSPDTGRLHLQGWAQLAKPVERPTAQRVLQIPGAHLEIMRGSCEENERYTQKSGSFTTFGAFVSMGERTDIDELRVGLRNGASTLEIADANFPLWCRFRVSFQVYQQFCLQQSTRAWRRVRVVLLNGRTRSGKTRLAFKYGTFIIGGYQLKWWDGYSGQDCIIIDDFADDIPIQQMLRILDGYQLRLPVKGAFTYANWTQVIITSNVVNLYSQAPNEHLLAFQARITQEISAWGDADVMPDSIDIFEH